MAKIPEKAKFVWKHIGNLRKYLVICCLFMTKATDFLTDKMKERVAYFIPDWSWQTWLILALVLTVAFLIEEAYYQSQLAEAKAKPLPDLPNRGNSLPFGAIILILVAGVSTDGIHYWHARNATSSLPVANKIEQPAAKLLTPTANDRTTRDAGKPKDNSKRVISDLSPKKEIPGTLQPSSTPSAPPGSLVQSNSGGINVQQGTTGKNSPIINSPITIGDIPKRISVQDKANLSQFMRNAKAKATIDVVADQYSGATQYPDDFYEVLKDGGWPSEMPGVNRYTGFFPPGKRFQGVVITIRGEPLAAGETFLASDADPLFYIGKVIEALGLQRKLIRIKDRPEGVITVDFEGGFSN
jgi:hypothetical protein